MGERTADDLDRHGVLRTPADGHFEARRYDVSPALAGVVEWAWTVEWDRGGRPPHEQATIPSPVSHLTVEDGRAWVHGPYRRRFDVTLTDRGRVVGLRIGPGALRSLVDRPVAAFADGRQDASAIVGLDARAVAAAVDAEPALADAVAVLDAALRDVLARRGAEPFDPGPDARLAAEAVALLQAHRSIVRVDQLAARLHVSPRSLQRLFTEHIGLGPAGVVRRFRLQDALQQALAGTDVDWARLAADLGYYDQAHLVREFTAAVGQPPARYARD